MGNNGSNNDRNNNVANGIILAVVVAMLGGLSTWMFKLDDRQFELRSNVVTRAELQKSIGDLENRMDRRFDNVETLLRQLVKKKGTTGE